MRIVGPQVLNSFETRFNELLSKRNNLIQSGMSDDDPRIESIDRDLDYFASQSDKLRLALDNVGIRRKSIDLKDMN